MKKFNPLNRDEMREIGGGVPPVCNVGNACLVYVPINGVPGHPTYLTYGSCKTEAGGCICTTEGNGQIWYGSTEWCSNAVE